MELNPELSSSESLPQTIIRGKEILLPHNTLVIPYGVTHGDNFGQDKDIIRDLISKYNFVVSEVGPFEIDPKVESQLIGYNPLDTLYKTFHVNPDYKNKPDEIGSSYYGGLLAEAWEQKKPVLHVDPRIQLLSNLELITYLTACLAAPVAAIGYPLSFLLGRRITRRQFLKEVASLSLGAAHVATTNTYGRIALNELGRSENTSILEKPNLFASTNPFSYDDFRNAGMITGLKRAAEENVVQNSGIFFVGSSHLRHLKKYGEDQDAAQRAYFLNINRLIANRIISWPPYIRLMEPTTNKYEFLVTKAIPVIT